ncbi:C40 family peptidase [[Brevibacterium] frigoritolerans]|uniref:C40 family peptidase n=1 Tax=Peribacillus frigoritolerans TaxID=450367 RepID=A0A941J6U9_9BACI|nr:C40 family peptidase [Peribacillus frigoritolerans]
MGVTHVGIYLGDGRFLNSTENTGVHISNLSSGYFAEKLKASVKPKASSTKKVIQPVYIQEWLFQWQ